jgi:hypothetical protein
VIKSKKVLIITVPFGMNGHYNKEGYRMNKEGYRMVSKAIINGID